MTVENVTKWERWYNYIDASGNMPNKKQYLKKKIMRRITKKKQLPMLKTLRRFGLVDFVMKFGDKEMKDELKKRMSLEKYIYADPDPFKAPDGRPVLESIKTFKVPQRTRLPPRQPIVQNIQELPQTTNFEDDDNFDNFDDFEDFVGIPPEPEEEQEVINVDELPKPKKKKKNEKITLNENQKITYNTEGIVNLKSRNQAIQRQQAILAKNYKIDPKEKFDLTDAVNVLLSPDARSTKGKKYAESTLEKYIEKLKQLAGWFSCSTQRTYWKSGKNKGKVRTKGTNLVRCFKNPRAVKAMVLKQGLKGYQNYLGVVVAVANNSPEFAARLGKNLPEYRRLMNEGMAESKKAGKKKKLQDLVIDWKYFIQAYKREKPKWDKFVKEKIKEKKRYENNNEVFRLKTAEKAYIINFLLLALPLLLNPLRDNFGDMKVIDSRDEIDNTSRQSYYYRKGAVFILRQFKTISNFGEQEYLLKSKYALQNIKYSPPTIEKTMQKQGVELGKIIENSLQLWDRDYVVSKNNGNKYKNGKVGSRLATALEYFDIQKFNPNKTERKGVKKPDKLGVNDLRHSRVTYSRNTDKDTDDQKQALARNMLHAELTADEVYMRKLGDNNLQQVEKDLEINK